jgi:hypothetical protein
LILVRPAASTTGWPSLQFWGKADASNFVDLQTTLNSLDTSTGVYTDIDAFGSPFATSLFGNGALEARLVSWGLRLRSLEPSLTAQGSIRSFQLIDSDSAGSVRLSGSQQMSHYLNHYSAKLDSKRDSIEHAINLRYAGNADSALDNTFRPEPAYGTPYTGGAIPTRAIALVENSGAQLTFSYEFVAHWEVRGTSVNQMATYDGSNPQATSIIQHVATSASRNPWYVKPAKLLRDFASAVPDAAWAAGATAAATYMGVPQLGMPMSKAPKLLLKSE